MVSGEFTDLQSDKREKNPIIDELFEEEEFFIEKETLIIFDYTQRDAHVGIERKSIEDWVGSIQNEKIYNQAERMLQATEYTPYIIIHGRWDEYADKMTVINIKRQRQNKKPLRIMPRKAFHGSIASVMTSYQIQVMLVETAQDFVWLASKIFQKHRNGKVGQPRRLKSASPTKKYTMPTKIISLVDGIEKKAQDIVDTLELETIHDVVELTPTKLKKVDGIGKVLAQRIVEELGI